METLEHYARMNNKSLSSVISDSVALTVHIFEQCLRYQWLIKELKNDLLRFTINERIIRNRGEKEVTLEEYCSLIWKTNIMSPLKIPITDYFKLNANDEFMGKDEKTVIRERLSSLRENYDMEKAIYIYNQRKFDVKKQSISGDSNIILIHRT
ncbi:hypothetical protein ACM5KI_004363, partial [Salmonella enterica subsp. enterica serovar Typhimurium]